MVNFIASTDILKGSIVLGKKHNVMHRHSFHLDKFKGWARIGGGGV